MVGDFRRKRVHSKLHKERVVMINFRKIAYEDLEFLNEVRNECAPIYLHDSRTFSLEDTRIWFVTTKPDYFIIEKDDEPIGYFRISNYSKINKNLCIGADLHVQYRGKGYAIESYNKFLPWVFENYDLHKVSLEVLITNKRALNLYKSLGFLTEGVKREEVLKEGKYVDSVMMSLLKKDFNE